MSERQRIGEDQHDSSGWRVRSIGYAIIITALSLLAISIMFALFLAFVVPEALDIGWSIVEQQGGGM